MKDTLVMDPEWTKNIVFFGTSDFAVPSLEGIVQSGRSISLVVTQPDRPCGRGQKLRSPSMKSVALSHGLTVEQPTKLKSPSFLRALGATGSKLFVVVSYGRILPAEVVCIPELVINVHASILPRWRGAAPIARAILAGDRETGISIMKIVQELDAGDIFLQESLSILPEETTGELSARLSELGAKKLREALDRLAQGKGVFVAQEATNVTLAPCIEVAEAKIRWSANAYRIHNLIRAFNPCPGAFTTDGLQRMKIFRSRVSGQPCTNTVCGLLRVHECRLYVATGDEWLEILEVQREGKGRQVAHTFLSGYRIAPGTCWR